MNPSTWTYPGVEYIDTTGVYFVPRLIDCFVCKIGGGWSTKVITLDWLDKTCKWIPSKTTKPNHFGDKDIIYKSTETIVFHRNGWVLRINA